MIAFRCKSDIGAARGINFFTAAAIATIAGCIEAVCATRKHTCTTRLQRCVALQYSQ